MKSRPSTAAQVQQMEGNILKKSRILSSHLGNKNVNVIIHGEQPEKDATLFMTRLAAATKSESSSEHDYTQEQDLIK